MNYIGLELQGYQGQQIEVVSFFEKFNMYQCKETKKNIVATPLLSKSDIQELIEAQVKIKQSIEHMNKLNDKIKEEEMQEVEKESIGDFLKDNPKLHAKAKQTLNKLIKYNDGIKTRKDFINSLLNQNVNVGLMFEDRKYKGYYVEFIDEQTVIKITKTEVDYYNYLKNHMNF